MPRCATEPGSPLRTRAEHADRATSEADDEAGAGAGTGGADHKSAAIPPATRAAAAAGAGAAVERAPLLRLDRSEWNWPAHRRRDTQPHAGYRSPSAERFPPSGPRRLMPAIDRGARALTS